MTVGETRVSAYRNVYDKTSTFTISIDKALERIKNGNSKATIIELRNEKNEDRQSMLKDQRLPSITYSGIFSEREDSKLVSHSGFICLDFDKVDITEYVEKFKNWKYTYAVWISPRGNGVKVLVRIANGKKHREHFSALKKEFPNTDHKCINESRVCYESYDPNLYINTTSEVWTTCVKHEIVEHRNVTVEVYEIYKKLVAWTEGDKDKSFYDGNRNQFIYIIAGAMCRYGISEDETKSILVADYQQAGFSQKEIERTISSAYKKNNNKFATVEFTDSKLYSKETTHEINPDVLKEGFKPEDVVYGSEAYEGAIEVYTHGYVSAESTHIPKLDEYFKFKRGELTVLSGMGNYGKSSYLYQLLLIQSYFTGKKWAIFSPEHYPASEFYFDLTEALLGCRCDGGAHDKPERKIFDAAYEFVSNHFFYIYPETISPTPELIKTKFMELILKEKISGGVIDPFNQMSNDYKSAGGRSDKYLETFLADCKKFAQTNAIYFVIVCHPKLLHKGDDGNYPCPDVFDLADGAMWNHKADNILVYHRPFAQTDPENPLCEHHSKKIRRQKQIGKKGWFDFELNRKKRRFYFNGFSPLDGNKFEAGTSQHKQNGVNPDQFIEPSHQPTYLFP